MQDDLTGGKLCGEVEVDETFIGGKARNMHKDRKRALKVQSVGQGKGGVLGMLERQGKFGRQVLVRAESAPGS